jgi:prevent-host-death family protein
MTIKAGEFKAKCLKLMDEVNETHQSLTITKRGVPVAKLVPVYGSKTKGVFGSLSGCFAFEHDIVGPVSKE